MTFQVGDKVKCVNPGNGFILARDFIYTIKKVNNDTKIGFVYLEEMPSDIGFFASRFEKVEHTIFSSGRLVLEDKPKIDHMALVRQIALEWRE